MRNIIEIQNISAPELDVYARLTQAQLRSRQHPEQGLFIAESHKVISHALDAGLVPVSFLVERRQLTGAASSVLDRCEGVPVYTADREVLSALTGYELTRGILCAMRRPVPSDFRDICRDARRIAVVEGVVDASNLGSIFRNAAALGMDAVLLSPTCCDPLYRRAVRVSMGTVFQVPWARIDTQWPEQGLSELRRMGFAAAALALDDRSVGIGDARLLACEKLALVLGTEGDGLMPATVSGCDYTVKIPMSHNVDSLNVAAASAVAFWMLGNHPAQ